MRIGIVMTSATVDQKRLIATQKSVTLIAAAIMTMAIAAIIMGTMAIMAITVTTGITIAAVVPPPEKNSPTRGAAGRSQAICSRQAVYNRSHGKGNADHPVAAGSTVA